MIAKPRRKPPPAPRRQGDTQSVRAFVKGNKKLEDALYHFKQGRDYELLLARAFLEKADGIGSGIEAAAALERKEHRR